MNTGRPSDEEIQIFFAKLEKVGAVYTTAKNHQLKDAFSKNKILDRFIAHYLTFEPAIVARFLEIFVRNTSRAFVPKVVRVENKDFLLQALHSIEPTKKTSALSAAEIRHSTNFLYHIISHCINNRNEAKFLIGLYMKVKSDFIADADLLKITKALTKTQQNKHKNQQEQMRVFVRIINEYKQENDSMKANAILSSTQEHEECELIKSNSVSSLEVRRTISMLRPVPIEQPQELSKKKRKRDDSSDEECESIKSDSVSSLEVDSAIPMPQPIPELRTTAWICSLLQGTLPKENLSLPPQENKSEPLVPAFWQAAERSRPFGPPPGAQQLYNFMTYLRADSMQSSAPVEGWLETSDLDQVFSDYEAEKRLR